MNKENLIKLQNILSSESYKNNPEDYSMGKSTASALVLGVMIAAGVAMVAENKKVIKAVAAGAIATAAVVAESAFIMHNFSEEKEENKNE